MKFVCQILILFFTLTATYGQIDSLRSPNLKADSVKENNVIDPLSLDLELWQPDPKKALWFSLALPGLGQIYNRSWWKTPLIYGGLGVSIWFIGDNNQNYKDFRLAYSESFDPDTENELVKKYPNQESLKRIRDVYYKRYQLSIIATAAIYLINGLEAYVDAHLKNFEISDDLSIQYGSGKKSNNFGDTYPTNSTVFPVVGIVYKLQ